MERSEFTHEAKRLRPLLFSIAIKYLGNSDDAEDVAQDAMLRLWTLCPKLQMPIDALASVLTHNLAKDRLKRMYVTSTVSSAEPLPDICEEEETDNRLQHVLAIIEALPPMQQTLIRLRHMEEMEYSEIAEITGSNEQAIRQAISRARRQIKNKYFIEESK